MSPGQRLVTFAVQHPGERDEAAMTLRTRFFAAMYDRPG